MEIKEVKLTENILKTLIRLSQDWEAEKSCHGYRANEYSDIAGNRIFLAYDDENVIGYLFGSIQKSKKMKSIMPEGTPFFEVEELYVIPGKRSNGIGASLFRYAENTVKDSAQYMVLSTATKNWKAILHFYLDELNMEFWSARLYRKI